MSQDASPPRNAAPSRAAAAPARSNSIAPPGDSQTASPAWSTPERASFKRASALPFSHSWLFFSLGVLLVFLLLWAAPHWQMSGLNLSPKDRLLTENMLRDTWSKILATLFFSIAAYFTWRHVEAIGKTVAAAERTVAAAEKSASISSERHITERFVRVMELLADEKLEVRLGGIYALERIARDSPTDQNAVTEVLATYVREHAPWSSDQAPPNRVRADVQAILTVLGRRAWAGRDEETLDLHESALATAYLPFAKLQRAYLYEANLSGAMLYSADLRGAWLWKAHLHNAILEGAHLQGADLTAAEGLTWEQLQQANLDKTTKLPDYLRATIPDGLFEGKAGSTPAGAQELAGNDEATVDNSLPSKVQTLPTKI